jgi:cytochrome c-type biogenesis protein CcmH
MLNFWLIAGSMLTLALVVIITVLLKNSDKNSNEEFPSDIYKQQLDELETDIENGLLSETEVESAKKELQLSILNQDNTIEKQMSENTSPTKSKIPKVTAVILMMLLPLFAVELYQSLGRPELIEQKELLEEFHNAQTEEEKATAIEKMLVRMEQRLESTPDDADGWLMLANSYTSLERYPQALIAVENLYRLKSDDASVMLRYADILSMVNNGKFEGKPTDLINEAIKLEPTNNSGLWLAGLAAIQRGEIQTAIDYWESLVIQFEEDSESRQQIQHYINLAREQLVETDDSTKSELVSDAKIQVNVKLSESLLSQVNDDETIFIYATAIDGPPIPLAILRKQVSDLPVQVTLDDSMSMLPSNRLSKHKQVKLIARISRSGHPKPEPGDLEGIIDSVKTDLGEAVNLLIDKQIQ